jgi:transcriptional regulator with XRE-family HTH domain
VEVVTPNDIGEFLTSRRGKVTPEQAGLTAYGKNRRVTGLRREEVALLAGISVEYYTRLERGSATGISESVLEGVARALRLDDAERSHLQNLVRVAGSRGTADRRRPSRTTVRPSLQRVLDSMIGAPAFVRNGRMDVLAANALGRALYAPVFDMGDAIPNVARFVFFSPAAPEFFLDWDAAEADSVAILRAEAGRDPYDKPLTALIGELSTRSERFRQLWGRHDVALHRTGTKRLHHPVVGQLTLGYEAFDLPADAGQRINVYTAEPGSPDADSLVLLASWADTSLTHLPSTKD